MRTCRTNNSQGPESSDKVNYLQQGWSPIVRQGFHYGPQGSELIPLNWFLSLQESGSDKLLKDDLQKFGVLYDNAMPDPENLNPYHLPIWFAIQNETNSFG